MTLLRFLRSSMSMKSMMMIPAEIAQTNLTNDLGNGVKVGLDDGVFEPRRFADKLAGVDVDRDESFGLVDDDRAAGLEPDLAAQELC